MSSKPHRQTLATPSQIDHDALIAGFIDASGLSERITEKCVNDYRYPAHHFLAWLACNDIALETVDGLVIHRFLQHDCDGCALVESSVRLRPWAKRHTSPQLMHFVRYLEQEEWIATPGDLDDNLRLVDDFTDRLRTDGYSSSTIQDYQKTCTGLIVWLHLSRLPLRELTPAVLEQFHHRLFVCSLPGVFYGQRIRSSDSDKNRSRLSRFMVHLATIGRIPPMEPPHKDPLPDILEKFSTWLEHTRSLCRCTCRAHIRRMSAVLPGLGVDPDAYDAARIRKVLWEQIEHRSRTHAQSLTTSMRMYLRFLMSEGLIQAALVEAVPTVPQWRLSTLPRYIFADDIERTIASCDDQLTGLRDRAILLLLARLALRAGDIVALHLDDIDWGRAEIRVSGKSRRQTVLPLPQDVGDALIAYLKHRPKVDNEKVFLCMDAPHRPFSGPTTVSAVARRALDRAGVQTFASRGAHVFRHSQATHLLRTGSSLTVVQSLLRHESMDTTMIYAKTDVVMLQEVALPWIGEGVEK